LISKLQLVDGLTESKPKLSSDNMNSKDSPECEKRAPYRVSLSAHFMASILVACVAIGFAGGRKHSAASFVEKDKAKPNAGKPLEPTPVLKETQHFVIDEDGMIEFEVSKFGDGFFSNEKEPCSDEDDSNDSEVDEVEKGSTSVSARHIEVEIAHLDETLLNSEELIIQKVMDIFHVETLSHNCREVFHQRLCVAVLKSGGHFVSQLDAKKGRLSFDLLLRESAQQHHLIPVIAEAFGTTTDSGDMQWSVLKRGVRRGEKYLYGDYDIEEDTLGDLDLKSEVVTAKSHFQTIEVYDTLKTGQTVEQFRKSKSNDGSYESLHPELFQLDREIFLDGVLQSKRSLEPGYHEALVHPAMLSHNNPRRVAIIGGGEGATLREVLKHRTVETATMVEIDEIMVNVSRQYIPDWSDCSDLVGSSNSCFEDPRADVRFTDAVAWLIDTYRDADKIDPSDIYDVIIMDALDPSTEVDFSDVLYGNAALVQAISNALGPDGVFIGQMGEADQIGEPTTRYDKASMQVDGFIDLMRRYGFDSVKDYIEPHAGFDGIWSFVISFKNAENKANWYANEAEVQRKLHQRLLPTISGSHPLYYFDGAGMVAYEYPNRVASETFCLNETIPAYCEAGYGFDPESNVAMKDSVQSLFVEPSSYSLIQDMAKTGLTVLWNSIATSLENMGEQISFFGRKALNVKPSLQVLTGNANNAVSSEEDGGNYFYNPFMDRNYLNFLSIKRLTVKNSGAGSELVK